MPTQTAEQFVESLQDSGLFVVAGDMYYFVPLAVLNKCRLPDAFLKQAKGISADFFDAENPGAVPAADLAKESVVFNKLDHLLGEFRVTDGVRQAIWLNPAEDLAGKKVSKAAGSKQVLFRYNKPGKKIVVDLSKGGRPSNS
jgi:hypothetical protein